MNNEITKEYFEGYLEASLGRFGHELEVKLDRKFDEKLDALEKRLDAKITPLATKQDVQDATEELTRITGNGFNNVQKEVTKLKTDIHRIKTHLKYTVGSNKL